MDILIVTVLISLVLVVVAVLFLIQRIRAGDMDHGDRLSLLPLDEENSVPASEDAASRAARIRTEHR